MDPIGANRRKTGNSPDRLPVYPRRDHGEKSTGMARTGDSRVAGKLYILVENFIAAQSQSVRNLYDDQLAHAALHSISDYGELSVSAVSTRICGYAGKLCGYDPSKLTQLKAEINKGFSLASDASEGRLPDLCMQTYHEIMKKLDRWSQEL